MTRLISLRKSHVESEGIPSFSKWLKWQMLLDEEEIRQLVTELSYPDIFPLGSIVDQIAVESAQEEFIKNYASYIQTLKRGEQTDDLLFRKRFALLFSRDPDAIYVQKVKEDGWLIKPLRPSVQLQLHSFFLSDIDLKFYPMVMSSESITWGLQFSYPQIFQRPKSSEFVKVDSQFPNTVLFKQIILWMRRHTVPTPFVYKGVQTNVPMRIGKKCFSWIDHHLGLKQRGLSVTHRTDLHWR